MSGLKKTNMEEEEGFLSVGRSHESSFLLIPLQLNFLFLCFLSEAFVCKPSMDRQDLFFKFKTVLLPLLIIYSIFLSEAKSADPKFEACVPQSCGNVTSISYPFRIPQMQESYCGYPGFEVTCENEEPVIRISGDGFLIRNITYSDYSLRVVSVEDLQNNCDLPLHNVTLTGSPFVLGQSAEFLNFYYNCTKAIPAKYQYFSINCSSVDTGNNSFAVFEHDLGLPDLDGPLETCALVVSAPVEKVSGGLFSYPQIIAMGYSGFLGLGFQLNWNESVSGNCSECQGSGGRCGFYEEEFWCFCSDHPRRPSCASGPKTNVVKQIVTALSICGYTLILVTIIWYLRRIYLIKRRNAKIVEDFIKNYGSPATNRYSYSEIKKMTSSFKEQLGQGGYGSVFKGKLEDGHLVAVKVLDDSKGDGGEFINEVATISRTSHVNIVNLLGFCFDGSKRALIYELMPNGSLEKLIREMEPAETRPHLDWAKLYQIAVGIARGLEYLHRGCNTRILHFDIKPHNILLDEEFCPKISDFGLAKLCPGRKESIVSMTGARGTAGYIAPEVFFRTFGGVSHKSDVYSYGMMVLEMVGGRRNIDNQVDHTGEMYFADWMYKCIGQGKHLRPNDVVMEEHEEFSKKMVLVGMWCIQVDPANRPSMSEVVDMLEGSLESLPIPPTPFLSSSRSHVDLSIR